MQLADILHHPIPPGRRRLSSCWTPRPRCRAWRLKFEGSARRCDPTSFPPPRYCPLLIVVLLLLAIHHLTVPWLILVPHHMAQTQALSGQAKRAELYREEAEALRERAGRLPRLQEELRRCRERLHAAEVFKGQLEVRWGRGWRRSILVGVVWRRGLQEGSGQEKSRSSFAWETVIAG